MYYYLKQVFFVFFVMGCLTINSQNLVPNPSFENTTANCAIANPEMFTNYTQVQGWRGTACDTCAGNGSTPDYNNNSCLGASPTNNCGLGTGSAGFFTTISAGGNGGNAREYVQTQLTTPLITGQEYCVSINVKSGGNMSSAIVPTDGLGAWFTDQMVDIDIQNASQQFIGPGSLINATPQISNPSGNIIDNNCTLLTGSFIAVGGEEWIVIGNFRPDIAIQTTAFCGGFFSFCFGYLLIDDVSVTAIGPGGCNAILPIELLSFEANVEGEKVKTIWSTATEINNAYFTIFRSKDAIEFEEIGNISGGGNSNNQLDYLFYDDNPYPGLSYYQISQTDYDGKATFSTIIPIHRERNDRINVFPNPAQNTLYINSNILEKESVSIEIFNSIGQKIIHQINDSKKEETMQIELHSMQKGVYLLRLISSSGIVINKQFIKN